MSELWGSFKFTVRDPVQKNKGSFLFPGWIVAAFYTLEGNKRYVVEHATEKGMLHIYDESILTRREVS